MWMGRGITWTRQCVRICLAILYTPKTIDEKCTIGYCYSLVLFGILGEITRSVAVACSSKPPEEVRSRWKRVFVSHEKTLWSSTWLSIYQAHTVRFASIATRLYSRHTELRCLTNNTL